MKKYILSFVVYSFLCNTSFAQVGVETNTPTEILSVNGTMKITDLPENGATNAIYTINSGASTNNTGSTTKNQPFNAINTVVADKNGVIGKVQGLPLTVEPNVKAIRYKTVTAEIKAGVSAASYVELGNLAVRFDGTDPDNWQAPWSLKIINNIKNQDGTPATADNVVANHLKIGEGGGPYGGQSRYISATKDIWYQITDGAGKPDVGFRDYYQAIVTLINTKEVYRVTFSVSKRTEIGDNVIVRSPGQVTIFMERLSDAL